MTNFLFGIFFWGDLEILKNLKYCASNEPGFMNDLFYGTMIILRINKESVCTEPQKWVWYIWTCPNKERLTIFNVFFFHRPLPSTKDLFMKERQLIFKVENRKICRCSGMVFLKSREKWKVTDKQGFIWWTYQIERPQGEYWFQILYLIKYIMIVQCCSNRGGGGGGGTEKKKKKKIF